MRKSRLSVQGCSVLVCWRLLRRWVMSFGNRLPALLLTATFSNVSFAAVNSGMDISHSTAPATQTVKPSVTFWGLGGKELIGSGQGLIPFAGDGATSIFYGAIEAAGSFKKSNGYAAGVAAGYRKIINNSYILGGYLFTDYNRSPAGHNFLVANPGFEVLGNVWDFRVNGYVPVTCRHWFGDKELGENIGITQFEKASGHIRYDHLFQGYEEASPGLDAEVGRLIPLPKMHAARVYVGGYHYFTDKTAKITGVEGRIVYPLTKNVSLELRDSYDSVHKNVFMGGIRVTFGGNSNEDVARGGSGIAGRLADPVEHNFGNFAATNSTAVSSGYLDTGAEYQLPGSFWYFDNTYSPAANSNVSRGDGSYEHPFTAIDSRAYQLMTNSGAQSQNVKMYVATGIAPYDLSGMPGQRLLLPSDYSIYGRTAHFTRAAAGAQRAKLDGGITVRGVNNNISDIQLQSENYDAKTSGALFLDGAAHVNISHVNINVAEKGIDAYGISAVNSSAVINNSAIIVSATGQGKESFGIHLHNSNLSIGNGNYIYAAITSVGDKEIHAGGVFGDGAVTLFGNNNRIIADAAGNESRAIGIGGVGAITISGGNNHVTANAAGYESRAGGIMDIGATTIISGDNNAISANAVGAEGKALGIGEIGVIDFRTAKILGSNKQIIISGSNNRISANSAESNTIGIMNVGGALTIAGNNNKISANSALHLVGHECNAGGIINLAGGTTMILGNRNKVSANSVDVSIGIADFGGMLTLSGNNNYISANSVEGDATGILAAGMETISGNNNRIIAIASGYKSRAVGIFAADTVTISGNNNHISANSAHNAAGIYMDPTATSVALGVRNTIFNVTTTGVGEVTGINLGTLIDATNIMICGNTFNVAATGVSSNAYGVYLPNATVPALSGNIVANIFNITNFGSLQNAWGIYANSNWSGASAAWIRAHNIWLHPTATTPQRQVYTKRNRFPGFIGAAHKINAPRSLV